MPRFQCRALLAETERRIVRAPVVAEPAPVQLDLVTDLDEERDEEIAAAVQHDRLPAEHRFAHKVLAEHDDAELLDGLQIAQVEVVFEIVGTL